MGKRQHIVPRFLLKRFASESQGEKSLVWRVPKKGEARLISTKDAAIGSFFYGKDSEGLESAFAEAEGSWSELLLRVDAGEPLEHLSDQLWGICYFLGWRTRQLRSTFTIGTERFLDHMQNQAGNPILQDTLRIATEQAFKKQLEEAIDLCPELHRPALRAKIPEFLEFAKKKLDDYDFAAKWRALLEAFKALDIVPGAAKRGHNKAISKLLSEGRGPEVLRPTIWELLLDPSGSIVLGESPVVAVEGESCTVGAPWEFGKDIGAYYVPIAPTAALVGLRQLSSPRLTVPALNSASAAISESAFFSHQYGEPERVLAELVGTKSNPITDEEVAQMVLELIKDTEERKGS